MRLSYLISKVLFLFVFTKTNCQQVDELRAILPTISAKPVVNDNAIYSVYIPKVVRPGFDVAFTVTIIDAVNPVDVVAIFASSDNVIEYEVEESDIASGSSARIVLGAVPIGYDGSTNFKLVVTGRDSITGDRVFEDSTKGFEYASKALTIMIQTDKAIYRPGEMIRFRALCLTPDLRPAIGNVSYQVQDPNENIVLYEPETELTSGVAGGEFPLAKLAAQGEWNIVFEYKGYKETLPVSVEIYKLPKFEVKIDTVSFIHPGTQAFTITLKADYTFGQPVKGSAKVSIEVNRGFRRSPRKQLITLDEAMFDGETDFVITKDQITNELGWNGDVDQNLEITGLVTEGLTSITMNETETVEMKRHHIKVEILSKPEVMKPGLLYQALARVTEHDGSLLLDSDRSKNKLIVEVTYRYNRPYIPQPRPVPVDIIRVAVPDIFLPRPPLPTPLADLLTFDIPPNGVVAVDIETREDDFVSASFRAYTNATENIYGNQNRWSASKAQSPSNSFIQVTACGEAARGGVTAGNDVEVLIRSNNATSKYRVLIISRGEIISEEILYLTADEVLSKMKIYSFPTTSEMTPSIIVLASYVIDDNEIVADYITVNVDLSLQNLVSVGSADDNVDAGTNLDIVVQTSAPGSYVGIRAIDQSVLLLKSGNDVSQERLVEDLEDYSESNSDRPRFRPFFYGYSYSSGARDAAQVFKKAGILVLTNAVLHDFQDHRLVGGFGGGFGGGRFIFAPARGVPEAAFAQAAVVAVPDAADTSVSSTSSSSARVRSLFPETWIWEAGTAQDDGSATFSATAPDTITSWVISAFSMSDEYGFGIADPYKLTVFRKFFISLNLPLKITRGEIIIIQASVFNYFEDDLSVTLMLQLSESGIELIRPGDDPIAAGPVRNIKVPSGGAVSVKFPVRINVLGDVPIRVQAIAPAAGDAVSRNVFVKPEGIPQCYSASTLIDRAAERDPPTGDILEVTIPDGIVPGSARATLHAYGNILGSTMSNLGRLLRAPGGCGEQNMLSFAPDVFVTLYLDSIEQLDSETRKKAFQHFTDGYQNELKFRHPDGSFSAFGTRDPSGSTWLTAFVAKCFIFADILRPELVESRIIGEAIEFLADNQNKDGSFAEPGRVIHTEMQGDIDSPITMTAYILITMRETPFTRRNRELDVVVEKAVAFLESNLVRIRDDPYALSIVTYALHVADSPQAGTALQALNVHATVENGLKFWHVEPESTSSYEGRWRPPYRPAPSHDIEMTAYALLTYARRDDIANAAPIMKWLISKQNNLGGYSSTQDTVIAVQALSTVARQLYGREQDLLMSITHSGDDSYDESFAIDETNAIVFNTRPVTAVNGNLVVRSEGVGIGIAQLSVCYNIPTAPYQTEPFDCSVNVESPNNNLAKVEICCSLQEADRKDTGMFLFEIGLLNGFSVDVFNEEERNRLAAMVELDEDSVNVYYDSLVPGRRLCANVHLMRFADVGASKPATISVFEYYKPDRKVTRQYNVDGISTTGACDICGSECVGCPNPVLSDWKPWTPCVEFCSRETTTRRRDCYDPSLRKSVDISRCGVDIQPLESRSCPLTFSCPAVSDGLWFDFPSSFSTRYFSRTCQYSTNRGTYSRRSPRRGIPGSILNGNNEYIQCYENSLRKIVPDLGFTISLLVRPNMFQSSSPYTFVSIGEHQKRPVVVFEKLWWADELRLTVSVGLYRYYARDIPVSALSTGVWSHILLTWSQDDHSNVYINGRPVGNQQRFRLRSFHQYQRNLQFTIGKNTLGTGDSWRHGFLSGAVSAFNYWPLVLPASELNNLAAFYREITQVEPTVEPVLSVRHLRDFTPAERQECYDKPATLSSIYAGRNGVCPGDRKNEANHLIRPAPIRPFPVAIE